MTKAKKICIEERKYDLITAAMIFVASTIVAALSSLLLFVVMIIIFDYPLLDHSISLSRLIMFGSSLSLVVIYLYREELKIITKKEVTIREIDEV